MNSSNFNKEDLPKHIAIIMDGNRRWARQHKMQIFKGHEKVAKEVIQELVDRCLALEIPYLTLWAFSTENWKRDEIEVQAILNILRDMFVDGRKALEGRDVKINYIGDLSRFPEDIQKGIIDWQEESKKATSLTITFALNYGGRDEIIRACNKMLSQVKSDSSEYLFTQEKLSAHLDTADLPDPDLIIRPGGERRLSGFMPWQGTYAELYFSDTLMPDFRTQELDKALRDYVNRDRRFGG